uniref:Kelch repeat protein n=1 Tax=Glossina morsitans morsitans TaxID=37546 RepID=A0A1B0G5I6_GLOMM
MLYVGGFNGSLRVGTVDVYDPATDQWSTSNSMETRRSTLGVAVLNGCIYAVGGFDGKTGLSSAEMFVPKNEVWRFILTRGFNGSLRVGTVDVYDPATDQWSTSNSMEARRSTLGVAVLNGCIYAVGGYYTRQS